MSSVYSSRASESEPRLSGDTLHTVDMDYYNNIPWEREPSYTPMPRKARQPYCPVTLYLQHKNVVCKEKIKKMKASYMPRMKEWWRRHWTDGPTDKEGRAAYDASKARQAAWNAKGGTNRSLWPDPAYEGSAASVSESDYSSSTHSDGDGFEDLDDGFQERLSVPRAKRVAAEHRLLASPGLLTPRLSVEHDRQDTIAVGYRLAQATDRLECLRACSYTTPKVVMRTQVESEWHTTASLDGTPTNTPPTMDQVFVMDALYWADRE